MALKSKYFFYQFKEQIATENKKYKAHNESTPVTFTKCKHKKEHLRVSDNTIRCKCGAVWNGPRLDVVLKALENPTPV